MHVGESDSPAGPFAVPEGSWVRANERGELDRPLALRVQAVLAKNKAERHLRGGEATRRKYEIVGKSRRCRQEKGQGKKNL